jgi:hypothetical protein
MSPLFLEVLTDDFENIQCVAYDETIPVTGYWILVAGCSLLVTG